MIPKCTLCLLTSLLAFSVAGCGRYAGGQGYNSIGHFCGGWAGNCGDGGIGGSTWYLVCDRCREKYLREKQTAAREKVANCCKALVLKYVSLFYPSTVSFLHHTDFLDLNQTQSACSLPGEAIQEETSAGEDSKGAAHYGGPPGDSGKRLVPAVPQQRCRAQHAVPPPSPAPALPAAAQPQGGRVGRTPQQNGLSLPSDAS